MPLAVLDQLLVKTNYDTQIRPLVDQSKAMEVSIGFELVSIVEINDVTQSLTVNGFMFLQWIDEGWGELERSGVPVYKKFIKSSGSKDVEP
ncbi:hypothetical protein Btru_067807 [Bulinus truncatus]|nr:hypothetical protein Btru_067807 [Bulinus truncatus]